LLYLDASALAKVYVREPESEEVEAKLEGRRDLLVSDLTVTEVVSSIARRRREGRIPSAEAPRLYRAVLEDLERGFFHRVGLSPDAHREAERLLLAEIPLRASDALHVALAALSGADSLYTFDRQLAAAGQHVGLEILA